MTAITIGDYSLSNPKDELFYTCYKACNNKLGIISTAYQFNRAKIIRTEYEDKVKSLVEICGSISSPFIQQYYETICEGKFLYCFLENEMNSLYFVCSTGQKLSESDAQLYFVQMIEAVAALHNLGFAHMDICPSAFFLSQSNTLKLTSFFYAIPRTLITNKKYGHINYQSPEIFSGQPYDPIKADIWALGILMLTMLTYQNPFEGQSNEKIMEIINNGIQVESYISQDLANMLRSMLSIDPSKRPSADELLKLAWINKLPVYKSFNSKDEDQSAIDGRKKADKLTFTANISQEKAKGKMLRLFTQIEKGNIVQSSKDMHVRIGKPPEVTGFKMRFQDINPQSCTISITILSCPSSDAFDILLNKIYVHLGLKSQ